MKALLADQLHMSLMQMRERYEALLADAARLDAALEAGERHAASAPPRRCASWPSPWACRPSGYPWPRRAVAASASALAIAGIAGTRRPPSHTA